MNVVSAAIEDSFEVTPVDPPRPVHAVAAGLDIAFQPIVDIHTGRVFGYEALMRNFQRTGHSSPVALMDARA